MTETYLIIIFCVVAYLLGSIPSAVWIGKIFFKKDVRKYGSGNAGATNTFRVLGVKAGIVVLAMDVSKGAFAAYLPHYISTVPTDEYRFVNIQLLFGFLAVLGHLLPVFANFKGGKGIATLFGMILSIHYWPALACLGVFILVLLATRYVSLGSLLAGLSFPIIVLVLKYHEPLFVAFAITAAALVILTHRKNITKLVEGTENKANIFKKKQSSN